MFLLVMITVANIYTCKWTLENIVNHKQQRKQDIYILYDDERKWTKKYPSWIKAKNWTFLKQFLKPQLHITYNSFSECVGINEMEF